MGSLNAAATVALKPSIFDHFSNIISMLNDEPESGDQLRFARGLRLQGGETYPLNCRWKQGGNIRTKRFRDTARWFPEAPAPAAKAAGPWGSCFEALLACKKPPFLGRDHSGEPR